MHKVFFLAQQSIYYSGPKCLREYYVGKMKYTALYSYNGLTLILDVMTSQELSYSMDIETIH